MDYDKNICPIVDVEGVIENGKQFDIEINLPEDNFWCCKRLLQRASSKCCCKINRSRL